MSDIIQLLPDHVANQIAAGEVVQRPASVVKELLENAIDAGATKIDLFVEQAGKSLIMVNDNGCGMTESDARMSFERHATSKISNAEDLFNLSTKGFRGEALASIAAVAKVELKTKRKEEEVGTIIQISGSEIEKMEPTSCSDGTSFAIKSLFYNIPARRKFLKSDTAEFKHILVEFQRVALTHPDVAFTFSHNGKQLFELLPGNKSQRVIGLLGKNYKEKLVPISEETDIVSISGYVLKPEAAKKTRGEQYFFLNDRFIKDSYLNHAVTAAFEDLIPRGSYPGFFIWLDVNPESIDINIHPTKTEVKIENDKAIYAYLRSTVKKSLGQYNVSPTLDFEQETSFPTHFPKDKEVVVPSVDVDPGYNPFVTTKPSALKGGGGGGSSSAINSMGFGSKSAIREDDWKNFLETDTSGKSNLNIDNQDLEQQSVNLEVSQHGYHSFNLNQGFIAFEFLGELMLLNQHRAHVNIIYERIYSQMASGTAHGQAMLFPQEIQLTPTQVAFIDESQEQLENLGFSIMRKKEKLIIAAVPEIIEEADAKKVVEQVIDQTSSSEEEANLDLHKKLVLKLARASAMNRSKSLNLQERSQLLEDLFQCSNPEYLPNGSAIFTRIKIDNIVKNIS